MKKRYGMVMGGVLIALFAVSCASAPPPVEPPPPPPPPAPAIVAVPAPDAEMKQAESLKETIETYNLSFAKPDEYRKANEELAAAKEQYGKDNAKSKQLLDGAIAKYNAVIESGLAEGSAGRRTEMQTAKSKADGLLAARGAPEQYREGQAKQAEAEKLFSEKKYQEAWAASETAITAYNRSYDIAMEKRDRAGASLRAVERDQAATDARLQEVTKELQSPEARP